MWGSQGPSSAQQGAAPVVSQNTTSSAPGVLGNGFNTFCNTVANLSETLGTEALQPQITALQNATTALQRSIAIGKQSIETQQEKLNELWADLQTIQVQQPSPSTSHTAAEQIQLNSGTSLPGEATREQAKKLALSNARFKRLGEVNIICQTYLDSAKKQGYEFPKDIFSEQQNKTIQTINAPGSTETTMKAALETLQTELNDLFQELEIKRPNYELGPVLYPRSKPRPLANPFDCPPPALENVFATIVPPSSPNSVFSGGMSDPELDALMEIAAGETEVAHSRPGTPQIASAYNPWGFVQDTYTTQVKQLGIETIDSWFEAYQTHAFNLMLFGHELSTAKQQDIATTLQGARNTVSMISEPQTIQTLLEKLKTDLEREVPGIDLTPIQLPTATPSQPIPIPVASLRRQPDPSVTFNPPPGPGAAKEA